MKSGKRHMIEGTEQPIQEKNQNAPRKRNLPILGNIGHGHYQTSGDEKKFFKKYIRRTRKLLETKLNSRNLIKGINTWAVPLVRYSGPFSKWTKEELQQRNHRTKKLCIRVYIPEMT